MADYSCHSNRFIVTNMGYGLAEKSGKPLAENNFCSAYLRIYL